MTRAQARDNLVEVLLLDSSGSAPNSDLASNRAFRAVTDTIPD